MRKTIHPYGNHCEVRLSLPWEVAEAIADHGQELLAAIAQAVAERRAEVDRNAAGRKLGEIDQRRNRAKWSSLARIGSQALRRRPDELRKHVLKEVAAEHGVSAVFLDQLVTQHDADRRQKLRERRRQEIVRLYFLGYSNAEIAERLATGKRPLSPKTVAKVLSEQRDLIAYLRSCRRSPAQPVDPPKERAARRRAP